MAENKEKLVLSFDPDTQIYKPAGHNLTEEQALEQARKLQSEGYRGLMFDQDSHHRALTFHRCKPCQKAAEQAAQTGAETPAQEQQEESASAAAGESESE